MKKRHFVLSCLSFCFSASFAQVQEAITDTVYIQKHNIQHTLLGRSNGIRDSLQIEKISLIPYHSPIQQLDGMVSGLSLFGSYSEPGASEKLFIRGNQIPLLNETDVYSQQPIVYLNGVPMIQDHPYAYDVQKYSYNRIGPSNNLLSSIDPNSILSVKVIKDPLELVLLGPMASNGAIWITTKEAKSGPPQIGVNTYYGFANHPVKDVINAKYEDSYRKPFYERFANTDRTLAYPGYLSDASSDLYYGPSNWSDLYYSTAPLYNVDFNITGGYERANFIFLGSHSKNSSAADNTSLNKFNGTFQINMSPLPWLTTSSMIHFTRMDRNRNRGIRDRIAEIRNIPDLSAPLSPNKEYYGPYLTEFDKSIDDNRSNLLKGFITLDGKWDKWRWNTRMNFDYNESLRDYFIPGTLMEGNNFVSNYYGTNTRININSIGQYVLDIGESQTLEMSAGIDIWKDKYKYNYATAYDGPNDYIKINVVNGNRNDDDYLIPNGFKVYRYTDRERINLISGFFNLNYSYTDLFDLKAVIRHDGSSAFLSDNRWFLSGGVKGTLYVFSLLNLDERLHTVKFHAGYSRNGQTFLTDRFSKGPQYVSNVVGWSEEPTLGSYNGFSAIGRPYNDAWIGYDLERPYSDNLELSLESSFFNNKISAFLTYYLRDNNNQLFKTPVPLEYGYSYSYNSGMRIQTSGLELDIYSNLLTGAGLKWNTGLNLAYNTNKLLQLPKGYDELIVGDRKFEVGKSLNQFWLYDNIGVINSLNDIPVNPNDNTPVSFRGVELNVGDPIWRDVNNDHIIDDSDKQLMGSTLPKIRGGLFNQLKYKNIDMAFLMTFSLGGDMLNQAASSRLDFINSEISGELDDIKEITFWQKSLEPSEYPMYNPWSDVVPYRKDQNLFLQSTDYLKLKSMSIGYDLTSIIGTKVARGGIKNVYLYTTATNLFTISSLYKNDPELVNYYGIYDGFALPSSQTFTLGLKLNL
jgi:TonB-linked SusC/RagA family outer membrane protein